MLNEVLKLISDEVKSNGKQQEIKDLIVVSYKFIFLYLPFNPIDDGEGGEEGGAKGPPTSFSPVTSTNVGISP